MRINERQLRQIIREEARRVLGESHPRAHDEHDLYEAMDDFHDFGGGKAEGDPFEGDEDEDDDSTTPGEIIAQYKDEGPRSWMRVSNDFHEMADGGMADIREKYYPGLTPEGCAEIARELDAHFGMD